MKYELPGDKVYVGFIDCNKYTTLRWNIGSSGGGDCVGVQEHGVYGNSLNSVLLNFSLNLKLIYKIKST